MAQREAAIRVTMNAGAFSSGMRRLQGSVSSSARSMGATLGASMRAGMATVGPTLTGMMGTLKSSIKTAATFGGAFAFGSLIKDAAQAQSKFRDIAFNVNKVAGNAVTWQGVQEKVQAAATKTGASTDDLANAFDAVFKATGNLDLAEKSLEAIGTASTATGESTEALARAVELLNRKFGFTGDEVPAALAKMIEKTGVGGKELDAMTGRFGLLATEAVAAGMKGEEGLGQLLDTFIMLDNAVGEKADPALKALFQTLKSGTSQLESLSKASGIKFKVDDTAIDKVRKIVASEKGRKAAEKLITGDARIVFDELAKPFDAAVKTAKDAGVRGKRLQEIGLEAFDAAVNKSSDATLDYAKLQEEAAKRVKEDPSAGLRAAVDKVKQAFQTKEMNDAISSLSANLPRFATGIAKVMDFATKNPLLAVGGLVGAKVGVSFASAAVAKAGAAFALAAAPKLAAAGTGFAKAAGTPLGKAAGVLIAAAIAKEMGEAVIDSAFDAVEDRQEFTATIGARAVTAKTPEERQELLAQAKAELEKLKQFQSASSIFDVDDKGAFLSENVRSRFGQLANAVGMSDEDPNKDLGRRQKNLEEAIAQLEGAKKKEQSATEKMAGAADRAAQKLEKLGSAAGGGTGRGPNAGLPTGSQPVPPGA